jgi:hypothetical protein
MVIEKVHKPQICGAVNLGISTKLSRREKKKEIIQDPP